MVVGEHQWRNCKIFQLSSPIDKDRQFTYFDAFSQRQCYWTKSEFSALSESKYHMSITKINIFKNDTRFLNKNILIQTWSLVRQNIWT